MKIDLREYGFASGDYFCKCKTCGCDYEGDKRSRNCFSCANKAYVEDHKTTIKEEHDARIKAENEVMDLLVQNFEIGNLKRSIEELVSFIEKGRFSFASTLKSQMDWYLESTDIINKYK